MTNTKKILLSYLHIKFLKINVIAKMLVCVFWIIFNNYYYQLFKIHDNKFQASKCSNLDINPLLTVYCCHMANDCTLWKSHVARKKMVTLIWFSQWVECFNIVNTLMVPYGYGVSVVILCLCYKRDFIHFMKGNNTCT